MAQIDIRTDFAPEDLSVLRQFHDRVVRLANTKLVKGPESEINASMHFRTGDKAEFRIALPPDEQIAEYLMAFRFFYLKGEETHFPKVVNIVSRYADQSFRGVSKALKAQWEESLFKDSARVKVNGELVTSRQLIDLWFNAHYFHGDPRKTEALANLNSILSVDLSKYMLLDSVYNASDVVRRFHAGIGALFVPVGTLI